MIQKHHISRVVICVLLCAVLHLLYFRIMTPHPIRRFNDNAKGRCLFAILDTFKNSGQRLDECKDVNMTELLQILKNYDIQKSLLNTKQPSPTCLLYRDVSSETIDTVSSQLNSYMDIFTECRTPYIQHQPVLATFLALVIRSKDYLPVPPIVHYVAYGSKFEMTFLQHLSLISVSKFINPYHIFIHGDVYPTGPWWEKTKQIVPNIYFINRTRPNFIHGKKIHQITHSSDMARFEIMLDYGGIYLDWDVLALRSFDPLRKYTTTLGRETDSSLGSSIILSRRASPFIRIWLETYHTFNPNEWAEHACVFPNVLQNLIPHLIHVEDKSLLQPSWANKDDMFKNIVPWRNINYAMHVWKPFGKVPENPKEIEKLNTTLGEVMRHVWNTKYKNYNV